VRLGKGDIPVKTTPFSPTPAELAQANPRFTPVAADTLYAATAYPPTTTVTIKPAQDYAIALVATFFPVNMAQLGGERIVAGLQTVDTTVYIAFNRDLPVSWFASIYKTGEISPNAAAFPYSSDADSFILPLNKAVTLTHDSAGWHIPSYDATLYKVTVGFGLGSDPIFCAYALQVSPVSTAVVAAGGFQLVRNAGGQEIGDVISEAEEAWSMPIGGQYILTFDASGNGTLSTR
jgi:hypothetical protein